MHFKPFDVIRQHAREKLAPFVDVDDVEALRRFVGVGKHLPRYFFMTEETYYTDFNDYPYPVVQFNGLQNLLTCMVPIEQFTSQWCRRPAKLNVVDKAILGRMVLDMDIDFIDPAAIILNQAA